MSRYYNLYTDLSFRFDALRTRYLLPHMPANPDVEPDMYRLDVMAYCLLVHAAVEHFVEQVGILVIESAIDDWTKQGRLTNAIVALLAHSDYRAVKEAENGFTRHFDRIKDMLDRAKSNYSKVVYWNNGITGQDMRHILYPCGIDLLDDVVKRESLKRLSKERGTYAHTAKVDKVMPPEDAYNVASDCLVICEDIAAQANRMFP